MGKPATRKRSVVEKIIEDGHARGYTGLRATRDGVEWGEPSIRDFAWERRVKARIDDVMDYLQKRDAQQSADQEQNREEKGSSAALAQEVAELRRRLTVLEHAFLALSSRPNTDPG